jgi:hypothetical protein
MTAIRSNHARVLTQLIAERRQFVLESMSGGVKRKIYHQLVGQLQGLDDALKLSEEADFKLNGEDVVDS